MRRFGVQAEDVPTALIVLAPDDKNAFQLAANQRSVHTDMPGGRFHTWERLQMPWRIRRDKLDVYHGTYNTLPPRWPVWKGPPMDPP